jgi:predicted membrane chloride channel (bestrophin family)
MAAGPHPTESTPLLGARGAPAETPAEPQRLRLPTASGNVSDSDASPVSRGRKSARASEIGWALKRPKEKKSWQAWGLDKIKKANRSLADISKNYSLRDPHCRMDTNEEGVTTLADYEVRKLTTMRVFFVATGTALESPILWIEMAVIAIVYWGTFLVFMRFRWEGFSEFVGSDTDVRAFISMFSTLIGLLLSFYTSLNIGRWWCLRTEGVEGIAQGASKLTILLSQGVTRDREILEAVRRYSIGSLMLFFHKDAEEQEQLDFLVDRQILTHSEADMLAKSSADSMCYPEALWVWLAHIVTKCNQAGLVKGPPHYCQLLAAVDEGRSGASTIKTFMETPIPMGYVHLLGLMVKLHNVILAFLMALVSAKHAGHHDSVATCRAMFRCFFMPFLYNAILIINDELTDPFGTDMSDFPSHVLCRRMFNDVTSFVEMGDNLPDWIAKLDVKKEDA